MTNEVIYIVERTGKLPEAFGSISAIFDEYSIDEVSLPKYKVWGSFKQSDSINTGTMTITKTTVKRSKHND